jgi:hypothetical protein
VHHEVRSELERAAEYGRRERVVDEHAHAAIPSHPRDRLEIGDAAQRIRDGLDQHEPGAVQRAADSIEVAHVDEVGLVAGGLEVLPEQVHRSAVQLASGDDGHGLRSEGEDREVECRHPARGRQSCFCALELGHRALEHLPVLVRVASVVVAGSLAARDRVIVVEVVVDVHRRGADGRC